MYYAMICLFITLSFISTEKNHFFNVRQEVTNIKQKVSENYKDMSHDYEI